MDVIEIEDLLLHRHGGPGCPHPQLRRLMESPNFIYKHTAYLTDEAYSDITRICLQNLVDYARTGAYARELVL